VAAPVVVIGAMAAWPLINLLYARTPLNMKFNVPALTPRGGWKAIESPPTDWKPTLVNPSLENIQAFEKNGQKIGVFIGIFSNQTWNSKLVSSVNHFIAPESPRWSLVRHTIDKSQFLDKPLDVKAGVILGDKRVMARRWYWVHGVSTADDMQAKIQQLRARIDGRADVSAWISIFAVVDSTTEVSAALLDEFMRDMGRSLADALPASAQP
jgi:EpsI family protein